MNTEQFKYLLAIAEFQSFSKAADNLFITQPYLSKLVASIEAELGIQLFERGHKQITITPAGKYYLEYIKESLYAEQKMRSRISEMAAHQTARLRLGIPPAHGSYILPQILKKFRFLYPGVHIILEEHNNQALMDYIQNSAVDLCCFSSPEYKENLDYEIIEREKILMVLPPHHPFGEEAAIGNYANPASFPEEKMSQLTNETFVILSKSQGIGKYTRDIFEKYKINPDIVMETKNIETAYRLAATGVGITFIPQICTGFSKFDEEPFYYTVGVPPLERQVVIAYQKGRQLSKIEEDFIYLAKTI